MILQMVTCLLLELLLSLLCFSLGGCDSHHTCSNYHWYCKKEKTKIKLRVSDRNLLNIELIRCTMSNLLPVEKTTMCTTLRAPPSKKKRDK